MKKAILSVSLLLLSVSITFAQRSKSKESDNQQTITSAPAVPNDVALAKPATTLKADDMAFTDITHDFGTVAEGPDATCEFTFKNNGNEPIVIEKAQPSCGCTVPQFSKEPVAPGATGIINVAYHTKGKPNPFTKTITVVSNAGTKVLTIKGTVEKAPTGSVPENVSMIKTN
jgi:hypothetical protein